MLIKQENKVMLSLLKLAGGKQTVLLSPLDVIRNCGIKNLSAERLDKIVGDLSLDGYFDLVYSDRYGEKIYCITFTEKGNAFYRNGKTFKRNILFRVLLSGVLAVFSFIVGLILKAIFK